MQVRAVATRADLERFHRFPWTIYRGDPNWVPPLLSERRELLDPRRNPFFEHAQIELFLATEGDAVRGRIAAIVNERHLAAHHDGAGFFGLFECVNEPAVAAALFQAAGAFLAARGLRVMRGPANLSVNDDIGLLVEGFDSPPVIMMPYNPAYYPALIEGCGFAKAMDLLAYQGDASQPIPDRAARAVALCQRRYKFRVRPVNMRNFAADLEKIHQVYSQAWQDNWGAVAMTRKEFEHSAAQLKSVVEPSLCLIAEVGDEVAGFSLSLPDFNQVLIKLNGRLLPFGFLKVLWLKRRINGLRVITMGVVGKFRHMGIDNAFYCESWRSAPVLGMPRAEMSWILETNAAMNNALLNFGFKVYKRYRVYDRSLVVT
ncbi:MAG: N-acetyltransferase [Kiritimatiellaeota bacterium]|nr:N-acetyltransferase [Kiritimatiellota bacterium]